jgi:hypothetical protein
MASTMSEKSEREALIRRRWAETGIKLWKHDVHGVGLASLNIQGSFEPLPVKPGEHASVYDNLEFKLVRSFMTSQPVDRIVCEGVVVDPPAPRE